MPRDSDYDFEALERQLFNGAMRWLSTILAIGSVALGVAQIASGNKLHIDGPIPMSGTPLLLFAIASAVVWTTIAVMNWRRAIARSR